MLRPFALIFFVMVFGWLGWTALPSDAQVRMARACFPVNAAGNLTTSAVMLVHRDWGVDSQDMFDQAAYGCRYMLWRAFYEEEWRAAQTGAAVAASPSAVAASTAASAPAKKHR
jgi:hypothetical protein